MFDLSLPWWHFLVRAALIYVAMLVLVRLSGKRTIGEFTPFDLIVVMLLGETAQSGLTAGDESVAGGLIAAATLIALNYGLGFVSTRSRWFERLVEGEPVVLVRGGVLRRAAARRNHIPESDVMEAVREAGLTRLEEVDLAVLETDGHITVIRRETPPRAANERAD
jgi:uncharacterized membrane protein YcaP (DUF421 family)